MIVTFGATSNIFRVKLRSASTGAGLTGLTSSTTGLIISTICDNEASATVYTVAASHIQTITTLGTYAAPSASNCRFKEVDATNHPGLYEIQLADARFAVSGAKRLTVTITGASGMADCDLRIELTRADFQDAVRMGLTALPNANAEATGGLYTRGSGAGQINQAANGQIDANTKTVAGQTASASAGVTFPSSIGTSTLTQAQAALAAKSTLSKPVVEIDARSLSLADSASITTIPDISGNGNDFAGGSTKPTYVAAAFNGYPAIQFTGSSTDGATPPSYTAGSTAASSYAGPIGTILAVVNCRTADFVQALLGIDSASGTDGALWIELNDGVSGANGVVCKRVTASGSTDGQASFTTGDSTESAYVGVPSMIGMRVDGSSVTLFRQGLAVNAPVTMGGTPLTASTGITLGARFISAAAKKFGSFDLYHLRVYREALTDEQIRQSLLEMQWMVGGPIEDHDWLLGSHLEDATTGAATEVLYVGTSKDGKTFRNVCQASYKSLRTSRDIRWLRYQNYVLWGMTNSGFTHEDNKFETGISLPGLKFILRHPQGSITLDGAVYTAPGGFELAAHRAWNPRFFMNDGQLMMSISPSFKIDSGSWNNGVFSCMYTVVTSFDPVAGPTFGAWYSTDGATPFATNTGSDDDYLVKTGDHFTRLIYGGAAILRGQLGGVWSVLDLILVAATGALESPILVTDGDRFVRIYFDHFATTPQGMWFADSYDGGFSFGPWQQVAANGSLVPMSGEINIYRDPWREGVNQNLNNRELLRSLPRREFTVAIESADANSITFIDDTTAQVVLNALPSLAGKSLRWKIGNRVVTALVRDGHVLSDLDVQIFLAKPLASADIPTEGTVVDLWVDPTAFRSNLQLVASGRCGSGTMSTTTLVVNSSTPTAANIFRGMLARVERNPGTPEWRTVKSYNTGTKTVTLDYALGGTPTAPGGDDPGTYYEIYGANIPALDSSLRPTSLDPTGVSSAFATATALASVQTHGDSTWATATGFATSTALSNLQTHGDSTWSTATGFATATNLSNISGRIPDALNGGMMKSDMQLLVGDDTAAGNLKLYALSALQSDGSGGLQLTTLALANAPSGSVDPSAIAEEVIAGLVGANLGPIYSVGDGTTLDLFGADTYANADGRGILITKQANETVWPTTLSTVHFYAHPTASTLVNYPDAAKLDDIACTVTSATGSAQQFRLELSATQLLTLQAADKAGGYQFWFVANKDTNPATVRAGSLTLRPGPSSQT